MFGRTDSERRVHRASQQRVGQIGLADQSSQGSLTGIDVLIFDRSSGLCHDALIRVVKEPSHRVRLQSPQSHNNTAPGCNTARCGGLREVAWFFRSSFFQPNNRRMSQHGICIVVAF